MRAYITPTFDHADFYHSGCLGLEHPPLHHLGNDEKPTLLDATLTSEVIWMKKTLSTVPRVLPLEAADEQYHKMSAGIARKW